MYAVDDEVCTGCGVCLEQCAYGAVEISGSAAVIHAGLCADCGLCLEACPHGSIYEYEEVPALQGAARVVAPYHASNTQLVASAATRALAKRDRIAAALILAPTLSGLLFRLAARIYLSSNGGRRANQTRSWSGDMQKAPAGGGHRWRGGR